MSPAADIKILTLHGHVRAVDLDDLAITVILWPSQCAMVLQSKRLQFDELDLIMRFKVKNVKMHFRIDESGHVLELLNIERCDADNTRTPELSHKDETDGSDASQSYVDRWFDSCKQTGFQWC